MGLMDANGFSGFRENMVSDFFVLFFASNTMRASMGNFYLGSAGRLVRRGAELRNGEQRIRTKRNM